MKTTIDMAREAGFETMITKGKIHGFDRDGDYTEELKSFEALIRADEREACAKIARKVANATRPDDFALDKCYEIEIAIRARGQA